MGPTGAAPAETEVGKAEMKAPTTDTRTTTPGALAAAQGRPAKTLEARGVNLYYGDFHAVESVTMTVEPNKVTALIGSSGCGKTTFLRSLNRMHELTAGARVEGDVLLDGQDIYAPKVDPVQVRRLVGMAV